METTIAERTDIIGNAPDGLGAALQRVSHEREFPQIERRSKLGLREFKYEYLYRQKPVVITDYQEPKYFFDWDSLFPTALRMPYPRLFLGPKGAVTPLNSDVWGTHAWLSQQKGAGRYSRSEDLSALQPGSTDRDDARAGRYDFRA